MDDRVPTIGCDFGADSSAVSEVVLCCAGEDVVETEEREGLFVPTPYRPQLKILGRYRIPKPRRWNKS